MFDVGCVKLYQHKLENEYILRLGFREINSIEERKFLINYNVRLINNMEKSSPCFANRRSAV